MFSGATSSTFVAVTAMLLFALDERIAAYPRDVCRPYVGTWHARGIAIRQKRRGKVLRVSRGRAESEKRYPSLLPGGAERFTWAPGLRIVRHDRTEPVGCPTQRAEALASRSARLSPLPQD